MSNNNLYSIQSFCPEYVKLHSILPSLELNSRMNERQLPTGFGPSSDQPVEQE